MDNLEKQPNEKRPLNGYKIILLNIMILAIYTIVFKYSGEDGLFGDAFFILFHSIFCFVYSNKKQFGKFWILSGFLVLIIGFSTCVASLGL